MFKRSKLLRFLLAAVLPACVFGDDDQGGGGSGGNLSGGFGAPGEEGRQNQPQSGQSNPWDTVPRSWAQEHHPHWQSISPEARRIIHEREQHVERGFQTYRGAHETWGRLTKHFEPFLKQNPQADVAGLYEALAQNHLAIVQASPEQRRQLFKQLGEYYGITDEQPGGSAEVPIEKKVEQMLNQALQPFNQRFQQMDQDRLRQQQEQLARTVDAFFSDPKNKFINEVAPAVLQLIQSGEAKTLDKAYKLACMEHPTVRAKYLADLAAEGQEPEETGSNVRNLKSTGTGAPSGSSKTIDDTMNTVIAKYYGTKR